MWIFGIALAVILLDAVLYDRAMGRERNLVEADPRYQRLLAEMKEVV